LRYGYDDSRSIRMNSSDNYLRVVVTFQLVLMPRDWRLI